MKASMKAFAFAILAAVIVALAVVPVDEASAEPSVELQTAGGNSYVTVTLDSVPLENPTLYVYDANGGQVASKQVVFTGSSSVLLGFYGVVFEDSYTYELKSTTTTYFSGLKVGPATYTISVAETENGSVKVSAEAAKTGDTITVTPTPSTGYVVDTVSYNGTAIAAAEDGSYSFTMPAQNVTVSATFKAEQYTITFYDEDGTTVLDTQKLDYGAAIAYKGQTPSKAADAQYTYAFAGWDPALAADAAVAGDATYKATYTATPIDDDKEYNVVYGDDITVVDADKNPVASGSKVKAGTVLTVTAAEKEGQVATLTASVGKIADDGSYTVTADVEFTVSYEDEKNTGIYADGRYQDSVQAAVDAVASKATSTAQQTVEISKEGITGNVTLADNVIVEVTEDGSYTGTVTYTDAQGVVSTVAVKIAKGSSVTITGGSVEIDGTFVGDNEFDVTSGTAVLSGEVAKNSNVIVNVDDGAKLQIGEMKVDETSKVQIVYSSADQISFVPKTAYVGPAVVNASGAVEKIPYNEGSRISFVETVGDEDIRVYENIYHLTSGGIDITVGVADFVVDYKNGETITDSDVYTQTARVDSYTENYAPRSNATPKLSQYGANIQNPGPYEDAVEVFVVGGENAQGLSRVVYADLTVSPVDISKLTFALDPTEYTYKNAAWDVSGNVTVSGSDLVFDLTKAEFKYTDADGNEIKASDVKNVGTYHIIVVSGDNTYYTGESDPIEFKIVKAPVTITLTDTTAGEGWLSEQYKAGMVTYSLSEPVTDGALTATLVVTWKDGTTSTYTLENVTKDNFDSIFSKPTTTEQNPTQSDLGYTAKLTMVSAETANFYAGVSNPLADGTSQALDITVKPYEAQKIVLSFEEGSDNIKVAQDGTAVRITAADAQGISKNADGRFVFSVTVSTETTGIVLGITAGTAGYTTIVPAASIAANDDGTLTVSFELTALPAGTYTVTASAEENTKYIDSDAYTLDLSGLLSNEVALYLIEENYPTIRYTLNQLHDLQGEGATLADGVKIYLPATAAASDNHWELQLPADSKKTTTYYADNGAYLVDIADRTTYTAWNEVTYYGIVFVAAAGSSVDPTPVDPTAKQSITIVAAGFYADGGEECALHGAGLGGESPLRA